jgi:transcriptional regulator with XRE-family HTH domain
MSTITEQVGQLIKETRKAKRLTQEELGEKLGIGKTTINRYESGKHNITVETLSRVLEAMGAKLSIKAS